VERTAAPSPLDGWQSLSGRLSTLLAHFVATTHHHRQGAPAPSTPDRSTGRAVGSSVGMAEKRRGP
jgi:hypothetical protein